MFYVCVLARAADWCCMRATGKSCLLLQFTDKRFSATESLTIGVEFGWRRMAVKGKPIKLQVWDTAGQETFRSITRSYYRGAAGACLVYDVTRRESFDNVKTWLADLSTFGGGSYSMVLIGNKADLERDRQVPTDEAAAFAEENGLMFVETSAKTGLNVDDAFTRLAEDICARLDAGEFEPTDKGQTRERALAAHGIKIGRLSAEGRLGEFDASGSASRAGGCPC